MESDDTRQPADDARMQQRLVEIMAAGVEIDDPGTTRVGPEVEVEAGARLRPFTILEGRTVVRAGAEVGPFVRLVDVEVGTGRTDPRPLPPARMRRGREREGGPVLARSSRQPRRARERWWATSSS